MDSLQLEIELLFINIEDMPYYRALLRGEFTKEDTMRAQLQDLGRSIGCQGLREIQLEKLRQDLTARTIIQEDHDTLYEVIRDEDSTPTRPSHFEIRLQIFEGVPKDLLLLVDPMPQVKEANRLFRSIFTDRSTLEITAAVGGIEQWYVPIAAVLEKAYLGLGYTQRQVETYTLHKTADIKHSRIALDFVRKYANTKEKRTKVLAAVRAAFHTTRLYDEARYEAAKNRSRPFESYLKSSKK